MDKLKLVGSDQQTVEKVVKKPKVVRYSPQNRDVLEFYGQYDDKHSLKIVVIIDHEEHRIITVILQKSTRDPEVSNYIIK